MRGFHRLALLGIGVLTAALPTISLVPAASAADGYIYIYSASSPVSNVGLLSITAAAATPINSMTAHLISNGTDVLDVSDFTLTGGELTDGTWTVQTPITQMQLPLGGYTVEVDATDTGGDSVTGQTASGGLGFFDEPQMTLTASNTTLSYDDQSTTFSGTVSSVAPDGTSSPLADQAITLYGDTQVHDLTTASDGSYSITLTQPSMGYLYSVQVAATNTMAAGVSGYVQLTPKPNPVKVTATVTPAKLTYGQDITVSGMVTYQPTGSTSYVPLPNSKVDIGGDQPPYEPPVATATTNAEGAYSATFKEDQFGNVPVTVYAGGGGGVDQGNAFLDAVLQQATASPDVSVSTQTELAQVHWTLASSAALSVTGCFVAPHSGVLTFYPVTMQYATKPTGPWKSIGTIKSWKHESCGSGNNVGAYFAGATYARLASAYYRLSFSGKPLYLASASTPVLKWKYLTKITNYNISPRSGRHLGHVTVTGRLWNYVHGWHAFAHQKIQFWVYWHKRWYYQVSEPKTTASGWFKARFTLYIAGPVLAQYNGASQYFSCDSKEIKVRITGATHAAAALTTATGLLAGPGPRFVTI